MSTQPIITEKDLENLKAASSSLKEISESLSKLNTFSLASSVADISTIVVNVSQYKTVCANLNELSEKTKSNITRYFEQAGIDAMNGMVFKMNQYSGRLVNACSQVVKDYVEKPLSRKTRKVLLAPSSLLDFS